MRYCITILFVCLTCKLLAQEGLLEFGTADKNDLLMKECPTDPSAPAMVLSDRGSVAFSYDDSRTVNTFNSGDMRTTRNDRATFFTERTTHTRIKIFSEKGLHFANVKLYYTDKDKYEQVNDIAGYVYNLDDKGEVVTTKLEKEQIFRKKENDVTGSVSFSLPGVKPGSVIEYRYTVVKKSFSRVDPWVFQREVPTRISSFEIEIPEMLKFTTQLKANEESKPVKSDEDVMKTISGSRDNTRIRYFRHKYTLRNVAGLNAEPYMSGFKNNLQRLTFQLSEVRYSSSDIQAFTSTWESLANDLDEFENFGYQLRKNVSIPELDAQLKNMNTDAQKIENIHRYVRSHFEWDGIYDFYCLNVKKISDQRTGSTGDINLMMLNIMQHNGIEAWPVLVSTRSNGAVFKNYPFLDQFNTLVVLAKAGDKFYLMNGADKFTPTHLIPPDVMSCEGLIVNKFSSNWIDLWDVSMIDKHSVAYMANISEDGTLSGDAYLTSGGYAKKERAAMLKIGNDKYLSDYLARGISGMEISEFSAQNENTDTLDLVQKFKFKYKMNGSGGYMYFKMNLFTGLRENPFLAEKRWSDVEFGYNRRVTLTTRIVVPDNFIVEALPKSTPIALPNSAIVFSPSYVQDEQIITVRTTLEINKPTFTVAEYPALREFYKKMFDMLNEQVVLKKK